MTSLLRVYPSNFNSIKVRLKLPLNTAAFVRAKFQFHKGTIKTHGYSVVTSK